MEQAQLNALVQLLSRAPMSLAEAQWAQGLLNEEQVAILAAQEPQPLTAQEPERMPEGWPGHDAGVAIVGRNGATT